MTSAIALRHVSKDFVDDQPPALVGVNLDVFPGTCTALLGPSGSGKSTILRIIAGLEDPSGGQVLVNGRDVTRVPSESRNIGLVFQRPLLFPHFSVIDNVAFAARASGMSWRSARELARPYLDMVHLADLGPRRVGSLSGGQEQRVALARALAAHPTILLLDEPFSALDAELRHEMHELLGEIRHQLAPTVLMVTHDRDEAAAVADRIAVIDSGQLLQHDTVDRLFHRPVSLAVARLMGGENVIVGDVSDGIHTSGIGRIPVDEATPDGPGVLVFRHESVAVSPVDRPTSGRLSGTITAITRAGLRRRATVRIDNGEIQVELPAGSDLSVADSVTVDLPLEIVSVVPM
ncbi:MAG: ABC transporter ATP-binding protein [Microbacteriaceae bacterium]